jgi:hypothetical protein
MWSTPKGAGRRPRHKMSDAAVRETLLAAVLGAALLGAGCGDLLSLHPLYTEHDRVVDPALEGRWEDDDNLLTVSREGTAYEVTLQSKTSPSEQQRYEMRLVDIGGVRMADILPTGGILGHMFVKVRVSAGELRIAFLDSAWLRERIPHEDVPVAKGNSQAVLIARTSALRKQVKKWAAVPQAYGDELAYRRVATTTSQ